MLASAGRAHAGYQEDRAAYDRCLAARAAALLEAQQIADLNDRARALSSIYPCGDAPRPAPTDAGDSAASPLTYDEYRLLRRGEISESARTDGILANGVVGLGLGQAVQGRWLDTGWIFTFGELATASLLIYGVREELKCVGAIFAPCPHDQDPNGATYAYIGGIGYIVLRLISLYDVREGPRDHNARIAKLKARRDKALRIAPHAFAGARGASAGLTLRF